MTTTTITTTTTSESAATATTIEALAIVPAGAGRHLHFFNHLASVKVTAGSSASGLNAVEFTAPRGFGPPVHVHREEDELLYLIDGEIRVEIGGEPRTVTSGDVVSLPHGIPHTFQVLSAQARFLTIAAGRTASPSFDRFVDAIGTPTDPDRLPDPVAIDPGHVGAVSADHGIEVLGPPPAPLA